MSLAARSESLRSRRSRNLPKTTCRRAGGRLLPFRQQRLLNVAALLGRHLRENAFALEQGLPLRGREIVPHLQALPDLRLLLRRKAAETLVVIEEFFLIRGRHLPQLLHPARR